jgi:hypothetical protein
MCPHCECTLLWSLQPLPLLSLTPLPPTPTFQFLLIHNLISSTFTDVTFCVFVVLRHVVCYYMAWNSQASCLRLLTARIASTRPHPAYELFLSFCSFSSAGDQTQSLAHTRQALCHSALSPAPAISVLN